MTNVLRIPAPKLAVTVERILSTFPVNSGAVEPRTMWFWSTSLVVIVSALIESLWRLKSSGWIDEPKTFAESTPPSA